MRNRATMAACVSLALLGSALCRAQSDVVSVGHFQDMDIGLFISGADASGATVDKGVCETSGNIMVGDLRQGSGVNSVVAFSRNRPPERKLVTWTNGVDQQDVQLQDPLKVPIKFWIIRGPIAAQRLNIDEDLLYALRRWDMERVGLIFGSCEFPDATSHSEFLDIKDAAPGGSVWRELETKVGFDSGAVNVYWVNSLRGMNDSGASNFGLQIIISSLATPSLLAHEIGHALALPDASGPQFDTANIMSQISSDRNFFTEGQTFRAHFDKSSILNAVFSFRVPGVVLDCRTSPACPDLAKRLYNDGALTGDCGR